jgi:hypothetical protein
LEKDLKNDQKTISDLKEQLIQYLNEITIKDSKKKLLICFDSIDQLQNSSNIEWILTKLPNKNIKVIYSTLSNYNNILKNLTLKIKSTNNFLRLNHFNQSDSITIVENWLNKLNRKLSSTQWKLLKNLFEKATLYPLYIKLIFDIISKWSSFYIPEKTDPFMECKNIDRSIEYYLSLFELKYGKRLVSNCFFYLTKSTHGLSENELEDILSLDDELLETIFQYHEPPLRRFPITLWSRIRYDLNEYLTFRELDGISLVYWYHRKFIENVKYLYIEPLNNSLQDHLITNIIHYFIGESQLF